MIRRWILIMQIAATYIGTVVGAGFASGQSILQFFTVYGSFGTVGILISTLMFMWIGTKMMLLAHRIRAYSYQELNLYLFGRVFGKVANLLTFVILFGVTAVMLSGTGSIFEEQLGLPFQLGILASMLLCYFIMARGMSGILEINSLVVPLMLLFTVLVGIHAVSLEGMTSAGRWHAGEGGAYRWLFSPFLYAGLNFAFAQAVMVPLAREVADQGALKWGGIWGGAGLGLMLLVSHLAMNARMPEMLSYEIPMAEIIRDFGLLVHILFLVVIYGEIFTTMVGNVFGITRQIQSVRELPVKWLVWMVLLASFVISQAGFASLLAYLYPLFGYLGVILLVFLVSRRLPQ